MSKDPMRVSRRETLKRCAFSAVGAAALQPLQAAHATTAPIVALDAAQSAANSRPGPRRVPAKVIDAPTDLDPGAAVLVAAPYSQLWNLSAPDAAGWREIVTQFDAGASQMLKPARAGLGVSIAETDLGGVRAYILTPRAIPEAHKDQLVVSLHGGGFIFGHGEAGTQEAMLLAAIGGYKVVSIDYRMAPDAPFPAAIDDVVAAWRALVTTTDPRRMAVEGTSAGGNLTLALMLRAKAEGLPMPAAIAPGSPPSDLALTGDSWKTNEWLDNVIVSAGGPYLTEVGPLYAGGHDPKDPMLSPLYGDFQGFPPAILTTGTRDLVLSDTVRVHRKLRRAGVDAELHVYEGLSHAQYLFDPSLTVSREVFGEMARFFDKHLAA
jgi:acetyl esterase/lipase